MLYEQIGRSGVEHFDAGSALKYIAASRDAEPASEGMVFAQTIHVIAEEAWQSAEMAQKIRASGWDAESYKDVHEFLKHCPNEGIVLAHEAGACGAAAVCHALAQDGVWLPVIGFGETVEAERIIAGMKAGAMDYLIGPFFSARISAKLQECAEAAGAISQVRCRRSAARSALAKLSVRERQVLDLLAIGLSNKEMARQMGISPRTVEIHRMKMMGKIGVTSCAGAVHIRIDALDGLWT